MSDVMDKIILLITEKRIGEFGILVSYLGIDSIAIDGAQAFRAAECYCPAGCMDVASVGNACV
jgi:hypothetical protein